MSTLRYFAKRTIITVFLILFAASVLFFLFRMLPGDYTDLLIQRGSSPEAVARLEEKWGINDPLYIQYWNYITNLLVGDMGTSFRTRQPVLQVVGRSIINSFILVAPSITTAYVLGAILGAKMGVSRGSLFERSGLIPITFAGVIPEFFMGILLLIIFSFWLQIFPVSGMMPITAPDMSYLEMFQTPEFYLHYTLPFVTIIIKLLYFPTLIMRTSVVEVLGQDFIEFHRAKGLSRRSQLKHTMKHASLPVITFYPISLANAIGGLVVVELVFNWPGMGWLLIQSVFVRDFPVIQFVFFLIAAWIIIGNFLVDIVYSIIDPRVTVEGSEAA